jgi:adenylate cyclase
LRESDGDLLGDGVNIAARLEGVAKPGAICLSEDTYRQVRARLDLQVSDLGQTRLRPALRHKRPFPTGEVEPEPSFAHRLAAALKG